MAESANKEVVSAETANTEVVNTEVKTTEVKAAEVPAKKEKSAKKDKAPKKSWLKGLKSEFKKIMWPDKNTLLKQTVAVVSITAVAGMLISVLDSVALQIINFLVK